MKAPIKPFAVQNNDMIEFLTQLSHFADKNNAPAVVDACWVIRDYLYPVEDAEVQDIKPEFTEFTKNAINFHSNE